MDTNPYIVIGDVNTIVSLSAKKCVQINIMPSQWLV